MTTNYAQAPPNRATDTKPNTSDLIGMAGLSALLAGACYVLVGVFHPPNVSSSVTTTRWEVVHILACAMCFFGLLGMVGLYARQEKKIGRVGLAGFLIFSLWLVLIMGFSFVEAAVLPRLATSDPRFVDGWFGMLTGSASTVHLGGLSTLWTLTAPLYMVGGLLFGVATFRARILPRWAGALLAAGTVLAPVAGLLPNASQPKTAVPVGLALAWLGYALWSERRTQTPEPKCIETATSR